MRALFLVFTVCAFASGFALRVIDPLIVPIAQRFAVLPALAAMLSAAYSLPYAIAQPFLGPIGDRFGKIRCMQVCVAGLSIALVFGSVAPTFELLAATRVAAGVFAGGLIPLVLAWLGDAYDMEERQVMIGRMLFAIITGQMLGSTVSGFVNAEWGWRAAIAAAAGIALLATVLSWISVPRAETAPADPPQGHATFRSLYGRIFQNPKAAWLYSAVVIEGALVFGVFPHVGPLLLERTGTTLAAAPRQAGLVLGAFAIGGLLYAVLVRAVIGLLGLRLMCIVGTVVVACCYAMLIVSPLWWLDAVALGVAGLGFYMLHNCLQTEATELAPAARGSAVALFACGFFAGQGLGPILFGALVHAVGFAPALFACCIGLLALGPLVVRKIIG